VSTSGSSNRSLANPPGKPADSLAPSISLSTSVPDLSFSVGDAPVKPSPGRYRRGGAGRTDSSNSIPTGASTPTQRSTTALPTASPAALTMGQSQTDSELSATTRSGHNRASSADDSAIARAGGLDAAKRYRRRSFNGLDANALAANMATMQVAPGAGQSTTGNASSPNSTRPASSAGRQGSRPTSSHSHDRQGSAGSASSNASSRSQVRHVGIILSMGANSAVVAHRGGCAPNICLRCWRCHIQSNRDCQATCSFSLVTSCLPFRACESGEVASNVQRGCKAADGGQRQGQGHEISPSTRFLLWKRCRASTSLCRE
jgi:hypothetical protein